MRRWTFAIILLSGFAAASCSGDRPRPEPTEVEGVASLFAAVRKPANNATVFGARPLDIQIYGLDVRGFKLTGIGYVVRRNAVKLDSVVIHFGSRADSLHTFAYTVPDLATNSQIDISAVAFGEGGATLESSPARVVVVKCQPQFEGCQ